MSVPRFDPDDVAAAGRDPWWGIHAARYEFARRFVEGRRVLDVACGTGYASAILGEAPRFLVGVDNDVAATEAASHRYRCGAVCQADAAALPFSDASFDVILSFETIEHLEHRPEFLAELRRIVTDSGILVLSTPNANHTCPVDGIPRNPHHVHEYELEQLQCELSKWYRIVGLLGQRLSPRIKVSPFTDDHRGLAPGRRDRRRWALWRVFHRLPSGIGNRLSRAIWRHDLVPSKGDYEFSADVGDAPVLVALCRPLRHEDERP